MSLPTKAASDDRILDFLSKLSMEIKEVKASVQNISVSNQVEAQLEQQKTAEETKARKEAVKLEEFFKEIFKRPGPKIVQEVNVDEVEESPREKLWKKYGDYRGNFQKQLVGGPDQDHKRFKILDQVVQISLILTINEFNLRL